MKNKSFKQQAREYFQSVQRDNFNLNDFNRRWKSLGQHIRRIAQGGGIYEEIDVARESYYHMIKSPDTDARSLLDIAFEKGGARGQKKEIADEFIKGLASARTRNFRQKYGSVMVAFDGQSHKISTWFDQYMKGNISRTDYYNIIDLFKKTNPKYSGVGSK